ncbi:MAG: hypothetical protein VW810_00235 [Pelagibacteraceae bacterium]
MTDKEKWQIQNKLYRMKDKKKTLERFIMKTQQDYKDMESFSLFKLHPEESGWEYLFSVIKIFILDLDKVLGYYYMRYRARRYLSLIKKEILTLTKEIKLYEQH